MEQQATVEYQEHMSFMARSGSGHGVMLDANPEAGGREAGPLPTELLLMGLGGCTAMDVISILKTMRQPVTGYRVEVRGTKAEQHPKVFTDITVEHIVAGENVSGRGREGGQALVGEVLLH